MEDDAGTVRELNLVAVLQQTLLARAQRDAIHKSGIGLAFVLHDDVIAHLAGFDKLVICFAIVLGEVVQRGLGKYDAPAEGGVWAIPLHDGDGMLRV